ncbi:hypothetical protein BJ982_007797 [Sphaerisporangium siamense]|uniref:Pycsar effector protein domain-containing protein n=1 Tax=Sphaerisporangium siamense TaxID=795645 RepID=A0A7W7GGK8_9ACTN|nr:Pycsar system effector family protein [Sphaerisporangium siamense]MBB4706166.1 hypothetical protein [Sphaerisporangium siamense]MBB4706167.1 hypothetical protein [Sphaerisporangium siamense]
MPTTPAARRSLARTLGLNRPFTALTLTALAVLVIATAAEADALYGVACVLALLAQGGLWGTVALLAAAVAVLLAVIRPSLPRDGGTGFVAHAALTAEQLLEVLGREQAAPGRQAADVVRLSVIALAKYRRIRTATHLMYAALAVLVATLPAGVLA